MLNERKREIYEKILLAKTIPEKLEIVERDLNGEEMLKLKFWFMIAQGKARKDWTAEEKKQFDEWYGGGAKTHLENIELLLRYEQADSEPKRKELLNEIAIQLGLNPANEHIWNYKKPFNHEYSRSLDGGNADGESGSEEEKKADPVSAEKSTLPADFLVKDPLADVYERLKQVKKDYEQTQLERQHSSILSSMPSYLVH